MVKVVDPTRDELVRELRLFRRGEGEPSISRVSGMFYLTEALGDGIAERAFRELSSYYDIYGLDPQTPIGAYFYLSGWGVGLGTVNQRRNLYVEQFPCDISTAWRRSERGIEALATLIRDGDERARPWAFISVFQSGNNFQPVLDFNLGVESWQPPTVVVNGAEQPITFEVRHDPEAEGRLTRRIVLSESPLNLDTGFGEQMGVVRVHWPMPVWPVWNLVSWTADPRILTRMRTFRQRAVEVSLEWWRKTPPSDSDGLVMDGAIWSERRDVNSLNLPPGWRVS